MKTASIAHIVKRTPLYDTLRKWTWLQRRRQAQQFSDWERNGRPDPPPRIAKGMTLQEYSQRYGLKTLVETGTFYGDMVELMKDSFDRIYSIEISDELFEKARKRFQKHQHIEIVHGDSGKELKNVLSKLSGPALFWLDGHYSGDFAARGDKDTPVYEELSTIFNSSIQGHVIIIDDARCFGTDPGYPTMMELNAFIRSNRDDLEITVKQDSIRITPRLH
jgi:predicted O-methyltransferase YrrM